jgi:CRP-like cAMP-binding protein
MKRFGRHELDTFEDGEIIVREGEETRDMYIIADGSAEVLKQVGDREVSLGVLQRGAFFGEMSLLEGLPRSATVRARGKTSLVILRSGALLLKIRRDPTFALEMLQQMSRRIRTLNDRLTEVLADEGADDATAGVETAAAHYTALEGGVADSTEPS